MTPWTVNRARDMDKLLLMGCEALITDSPVLLRDRIDAFEFSRSAELRARFQRGEESPEFEATDTDSDSMAQENERLDHEWTVPQEP